jgi:hypothetical protein
MLAAPAAARAQTPPAEPIGGAPYVHIETNEPSAILLRVPRSPWERASLGAAYRDLGVPICRAPCDTSVDARRGDVLLVASPDSEFPRSPGFRLGPAHGTVTLSVEAGSKKRKRGGVALLAAGGALTGIGMFVGLFFGLTQAVDSDSSPPNVAAIVGGAMVGTGVVAMVSGVAIFVSNRTTVEVIPGPGVPLGRSARLEGLRLLF